ncbi:lysine exporter LysO family protein [Neisseria sp. ZJ106]|uniref:Lysine exporter LysO family protein n=1 Tax=Neisseria lisongii TaxID=2912188 RepID=A0ABY7RK72_9NEIS|nr:lysine exporter LysO family protein [Neisseria lisongii]MCF7521421.1 lysine exporter LysO family protein [Neisseria lisongii]WCL71941.1 lysine exporter LysO family protein [Neisseria lisongii]
MESLITLVSVLTPMFAGFFIRVPKHLLPAIDKVLTLLVYIILLLIGVSLSQVENLFARLDTILWQMLLLFGCIIGMNLVVLVWFDRRHPWQLEGGRKTSVSISGSIKQLGCVVVGFILGSLLPQAWLPPEKTGMYFLMAMVLLVGIQLNGSGIKIRQVLINKRGVQTGLLLMASSLAGGLLFAACVAEVSWTQGLAMASGFGWYSLSGLVMTEAYGAVWGSVALLNDLGREFLALLTIPLLMRRCPSSAVGIGGATSLDFTLPVIQGAGGLQVVPLAISAGFLINVAAPFLMVVFSSFG